MLATTNRLPSFALLLLWGGAIAACLLDVWHHPEIEMRHRDTLATARLAVGLMGLGWCLAILNRTAYPIVRLVWTLGVVTLIIHIVVALGLAHGWSHEAAVARVREVGGFGGGILVSYLFVLVWCADAIWWWIDAAGRARRPRWLGAALHGFLAFVLVNATEVYVTPEMRIVFAVTLWLPIAACVLWRLTARANLFAG